MNSKIFQIFEKKGSCSVTSRKINLIAWPNCVVSVSILTISMQRHWISDGRPFYTFSWPFVCLPRGGTFSPSMLSLQPSYQSWSILRAMVKICMLGSGYGHHINSLRSCHALKSYLLHLICQEASFQCSTCHPSLSTHRCHPPKTLEEKAWTPKCPSPSSPHRCHPQRLHLHLLKDGSEKIAPPKKKNWSLLDFKNNFCINPISIKSCLW